MPSAYPPIALTNTIFQKSRDYRDFLEAAHQCNELEGYSTWPKWCYIPHRIAIAAGARSLRAEEQTGENLEYIGIVSDLLCSMIPWSQQQESRQICIPASRGSRIHIWQRIYFQSCCRSRVFIWTSQTASWTMTALTYMAPSFGSTRKKTARFTSGFFSCHKLRCRSV